MIDTKADLKQAVLEQLGSGKNKAISGKLLAQRLEERDTRHIRLAIQELILDGYPIIAKASNGYFIADCVEDCKQNLETLMSYLKMIARHHKYLQKATRKKFSGQLSMRF